MTPNSLHILSSSLQAMPVAVVFSTKLLLTEKSSVAVSSNSPDSQRKSLAFRATKLTTVLKGIPGYHHGGLNE
jgi:hypothetical protein